MLLWHLFVSIVFVIWCSFQTYILLPFFRSEVFIEPTVLMCHFFGYFPFSIFLSLWGYSELYSQIWRIIFKILCDTWVVALLTSAIRLWLSSLEIFKYFFSKVSGPYGTYSPCLSFDFSNVKMTFLFFLWVKIISIKLILFLV